MSTIHNDIIPAGAWYNREALPPLEEGDKFPGPPQNGDQYFYDDCIYEYTAKKWVLKLALKDKETYDIPSAISYEPVTSIGVGAFACCTSLTSINLSGCISLTTIGGYAFAYCMSLTSINIPYDAIIGNKSFPPYTKVIRLPERSLADKVLSDEEKPTVPSGGMGPDRVER